MKTALVTCFFPDENIDEILANSKGIVQNAANALQKAIIVGLLDNNFTFDIFNVPSLGSYPKRYRNLLTPNNKFRIFSKSEPLKYTQGKNLRYLNLSLIRYKSIEYKLRKALRKWVEENKEDKKIIIIYSLSISALKAAVYLKKRYTNISIICIVPDLLQFVSAGGSSFIRKWYKNRNTHLVERLYPYVDGYVVLTEYMIDLISSNTPYEVIEGIYDSQDELQRKIIDQDNYRYVAYAGTLAKKYGILNLVKAFSIIDNPKIRLLICGEGDARKEIEEFAKKDKRIVLTGNISRPEVLKILHGASVIVNPRTPDGEYTKFSFPSKTMEYLASGVPTILYKLPGIPDEYYNYSISLSDTSIDRLAKSISEILEIPEEERLNFGRKARLFILNKKNPKIQTEKIIKLISRICQSSTIKPS